MMQRLERKTIDWCYRLSAAMVNTLFIVVVLLFIVVESKGGWGQM